MFFRLESSISSPYAIIDMEKFQKQYYDFFIKKEGNGKFLDYVTLSFKAQEGYSTDKVDESQSEYRKLRDGDNVLSRVVYHENDESNFFIARDSKELFLYTVTTQFKEFVLRNNLNINLSPAK